MVVCLWGAALARQNKNENGTHTSTRAHTPTHAHTHTQPTQAEAPLQGRLHTSLPHPSAFLKGEGEHLTNTAESY